MAHDRPWRRRWRGWVISGAGLLAAGGAVALTLQPRVTLPRDEAPADFPPAFRQALRAARASIRDPQREPDAVRRLARLYQANGFRDAARACYRAIVSSSGGSSARDHYALAHLALDESDLASAEKELRAAAAAEAWYPPIHATLAEILFKSGRSDDAAREWARVLERAPDDAAAALGLARVELQHGDLLAAAARLERLCARRPESASAAMLLAQVLERAGEVERASVLRQASRRRHDAPPADPWLDELFTECYDRQRLALKIEDYINAGRLDAALPLLERAEALDAGGWIAPMLRGWVHARAGRDAAALEEFRRAVDRGGSVEKIVPLMAIIWQRQGQLSAAAAALADYHARAPESAGILAAYADVVLRLGDKDRARQLLAEALAKDPYLYAPNMQLARMLWEADERDVAAPCLRRVAAAFPGDIACRGLLAEYHLGRGEPAAAIPLLEQALASATPKSDIASRLATLLAQSCLQVSTAAAARGDWAGAKDSLAKAVGCAPDNAETLAAYAGACAETRDFAPAADALRRLARLQPANPTIAVSLGDVLDRAGQPAVARAEWLRAAELVAPADHGLRAAIAARLNGLTSDASR